MKLDAVPPEILHIDLFEEIDKHKETTTDSEQVEGEVGRHTTSVTDRFSLCVSPP